MFLSHKYGLLRLFDANFSSASELGTWFVNGDLTNVL
jgi:hypothetical protein